MIRKKFGCEICGGRNNCEYNKLALKLRGENFSDLCEHSRKIIEDVVNSERKEIKV